MQLFARHDAAVPDVPASSIDAYKQGRRDEQRHIESGVVDHRVVKKELDDAYVRGLREGRLQRRGSGLGVVALLILLALIVATAFMVYQYGSFGAAGAVIDHLLSNGVQSAQQSSGR